MGFNGQSVEIELNIRLCSLLVYRYLILGGTERSLMGVLCTLKSVAFEIGSHTSGHNGNWHKWSM